MPSLRSRSRPHHPREDFPILPDPLRPAVVHLPIALAVSVPGLALLARWTIARVWVPVCVRGAVVLLEDVVEAVVAERHIDGHEETAERRVAIAGLGLIIMATGLLPEHAGTAGRAGGTLAAFAILAAGISVGHSGGELVDEHGAASAYVDASGFDRSARPFHHD